MKTSSELLDCPLFKKCIKIRRGGKQITCKLGLWSVEGGSKDLCLDAAFRYWFLYYTDGEYSELLTSPSKSTIAKT